MSKGELFLLDCLELGHQFLFPYLCTWTETSALPGLKPASIWTMTIPLAFLVLRPLDSNCNYTTGSHGSPTCWLKTSRPVSFHCVNQFLIINLCLSVCLSLNLSLSVKLWMVGKKFNSEEVIIYWKVTAMFLPESLKWEKLPWVRLTNSSM